VADTARSLVTAFLITAAALAAAVLTLTPAAAAHGGGGALGFRSTVTRVTPPIDGLTLTILDADDRLELDNRSGKPIVILGYQGEPYLAFRDGNVYRNSHSPATYLNDDRFGQVELPSQANAKAAPDWVEVGQRETYDWHDHRIHWMSRSLPPRIAATKDQAQHVFDWTVPGTIDGRPLRIAGSLDYQPPPSSGVPVGLVIAGLVIVVGGALAVLLRILRERRAPVEPA
jgi:hypothetical protein